MRIAIVLVFLVGCSSAGVDFPEEGDGPDAGCVAPESARPCYADRDPLACGCCFGADGAVDCPPNVVPPSGAVLTLPVCSPR